MWGVLGDVDSVEVLSDRVGVLGDVDRVGVLGDVNCVGV